ncbi:MAG: hypothetical protein JKY08_07880 [Flavobacteriaceae bacterium]|nr:hypothetical protein [Flavobacteriaceae bacterium]
MSNKTFYIADVSGNSNFQNATLQVVTDTYLTIYGSGFLNPNELTHYNTGDAFKEVAEARNKINKKNFPTENHVLEYCPTDTEFFNLINKQSRVKRLDVYCHGWLHGLNLGGFKGKRIIGGVEKDGDIIDWEDRVQDGGRDLRRVEIHENLYLTSVETNELTKISSSVFKANAEVYFWGCNIGGQLSRKGNHIGQNESVREGIPSILDPKKSFAQFFANQLGKGFVYALVGKGVHAGSVFKQDVKGKNIYADGEMLPANIAANKGYKNTLHLKAINYMKKFPIKP